MTEDRFGTERLRAATLAAWSASPSRFREDANTEEDHGHGYYRDRVVVELAQNAADAAARSGTSGRLLLRLVVPDRPGPVASLVVANTGAPLDAVGLTSLTSLRASAKRGPGPGSVPVGRFGVGFAAVRSVADRVTVSSTSGTVHFSVDRTARALAAVDVPELAAEVARRGDRLPALRLPWPGPASSDLVGPVPGDGWDTVVRLELRDSAALEAVRTQLDAVGDALLLALPALASIEVITPAGSRTVCDVADRWVVATRTGVLPASLLADRPVEERDRDGWRVTWAAPRAPGRTAPLDPAVPDRAMPGPATPEAVVHAPTPTQEPCTVPALLVATFPLDPTRRQVAPGPVTDTLVSLAGEVWADLMEVCRDECGAGGDAPEPLDLLPTGLPAGALDAALHDAVIAATREVPLFAPADGGPVLSAQDAVVLDGPGAEHPGAATVLGAWWPALVEVPRRHRPLLVVLGVERTRLADVVETLPGDDAARRRALYDVFADADPATLEELATLPVPLADGRVVRGARGLLVAEGVPDHVLGVLGGWGVRLVRPTDAHPLLLRLGAEPADAAALSRHPVLRRRVLEDHEPDPGEDGSTSLTAAAAALLALLAAAPTASREPWWGEVLLPALDGELVPARGLVLPGSPAAAWFDPRVLPPVADAVAHRWGEVLVRVGVRAGLVVERVGATDRPVADLTDALADGTLAELPVAESLDGWDGYLDVLGEMLDTQVRTGGTDRSRTADPDVLVAVADLDAVRPEVWPGVLRALSVGEPRRALVEPVRLGGACAPSYTAWWLRYRSGLLPGRPFALPTPDGGHRTGGLLDPVPDVLDGLDPEVLRALGGTTGPGDLDVDGWSDLLDALPPTGQAVDLVTAVELWRGLLAVAARTEAVLDAERLPALTVGADPAPVAARDVVVVPAERVAVADPMWAQHPGVGPVMVVPERSAERVAHLLDLDLASERAEGAVTSVGLSAPVPDAVRQAFPGAPPTWLEHEDLRVDGRRVDWWVTVPGSDTMPRGAAVTHRAAATRGATAPEMSAELHAATAAGLAEALAHVLGYHHRGRLERLLLDPGAVRDVLLDLAGQDLAERDLAGPAGTHRDAVGPEEP